MEIYSLPIGACKWKANWQSFFAGALQARRETLLSLLQHKFGPLPAAVVEQVNATTNLTRLDQWLLQVLDADHLTAIDWATTITAGDE